MHDELHPVRPTVASSIIFSAKARLLQFRRSYSDFSSSIRKLEKKNRKEFVVLLVQSSTPLWSATALGERALEFGKVQNLRVAAREIDGVVIEAGETFSFWKQIGKATRKRGYALGRELREGCLVPAIGGGLCQLSNSLYDCLLKAEFDVTERHPHSQVIPGSAAEQGRDATVFWNYVDLRFRPDCSVYIEARLAADELVIRLWAREERARVRKVASLSSTSGLQTNRNQTPNNCLDCGISSCFRHVPRNASMHTIGVAYVLDECWPEFRDYVSSQRTKNDFLLIPIDGRRWNRPNYSWNVEGFSNVCTARWQTAVRAFSSRRLGNYGVRRLEAQLEDAAALATHFGKRIKNSVQQVCISQSLLPFLWDQGVLGGRTFDVLMTRMPLHLIHRSLDDAAASHPERFTLAEFRAPEWMVTAESQALGAARNIVTPHSFIQHLFSDKTVCLSWNLPTTNRPLKTRRGISFPGPSAARKGAYELRSVARDLDLEVLLLGSDLEGASFWKGIRTTRVDKNFSEAGALVVQPALLEDNPRTLLRAIAMGMTVIATSACGLDEFPQVVKVPYGDVGSLKEAIRAQLRLQGR